MPSLPVLVSLLWFASMAAAVAHAAQRLQRWWDLAWLLAPLALIILVTRWIQLPQAMIGIAVCVFAGWRLVRPGSLRLSLSFAGVSSALAASLYIANSADVWLSVALSLAIVLLGVWLARDPRFALPRMTDFVLLAVAWIAPVLAAAPEVASGWRSAQALNQATEAGSSHSIPLWTLALVTVALVGGAVRAYWMKR